jgi:hypothetical protein
VNIERERVLNNNNSVFSFCFGLLTNHHQRETQG